MAISKDTVKHVAHLARIELSTEELERLSGQFQEILDFIDQLKKTEIKGINPTSHILPISNVLRPDLPGVSLPAKEATKNAPHREQSFFGVPQVIE